MIGGQHISRVRVRVDNVVVMRHAIMGRIQVTIDHFTDDLLIAGKGKVVTGPVIGVDMGRSNAY